MIRLDYVIENGHVIDPSQNIDGIRNIYVRNSRIVSIPENESYECSHVIDASGCMVSPGWIDFHTHLFREGSNICIDPDMMISQGTVAAVDAGSAGSATYEAFYKSVIAQSMLRVKAFLTLYAGGQLDPKLLEDFNPELYNFDKIERIAERHNEDLLGFKIRISRGVVPDDKGMDYLRAVVDAANTIGEKIGRHLLVCVHTTNSPMTAGELAGALRPGDIFCHCFQGAGNTIVLEDGSIDPGILGARKRGVLFDSANGKGNFGARTAEKALKAGFLPDIISTDLTVDKFNMPPYCKNLPTLLSKYITLGMNLKDIIRCVTETPAKVMGLSGTLGTLKAGSPANITVFKSKQVKITHKDFKDDELHGDVLLVPQMTVIEGEIQYCQTDFWY